AAGEGPDGVLLAEAAGPGGRGGGGRGREAADAFFGPAGREAVALAELAQGAGEGSVCPVKAGALRLARGEGLCRRTARQHAVEDLDTDAAGPAQRRGSL